MHMEMGAIDRPRIGPYGLEVLIYHGVSDLLPPRRFQGLKDRHSELIELPLSYWVDR